MALGSRLGTGSGWDLLMSAEARRRGRPTTAVIANPATAVTTANINQPCGFGFTVWVSTHGAAAAYTAVPI